MPTPISNDDKLAVATINGLILICTDAMTGFREAVDHVGDALLKEQLRAYAEERSGFASALGDEVTRLGGVPSEGGTFVGGLRRGWVAVRAMCGTATERGLVAACAKAESAALVAYGVARAQPCLRRSTRALIQDQCDAIERASEKLEALQALSS